MPKMPRLSLSLWAAKCQECKGQPTPPPCYQCTFNLQHPPPKYASLPRDQLVVEGELPEYTFLPNDQVLEEEEVVEKCCSEGGEGERCCEDDTCGIENPRHLQFGRGRGGTVMELTESLGRIALAFGPPEARISLGRRISGAEEEEEDGPRTAWVEEQTKREWEEDGSRLESEVESRREYLGEDEPIDLPDVAEDEWLEGDLFELLPDVPWRVDDGSPSPPPPACQGEEFRTLSRASIGHPSPRNQSPLSALSNRLGDHTLLSADPSITRDSSPLPCQLLIPE